MSLSERLLSVKVHCADYREAVRQVADWIERDAHVARFIVQTNVNSIVNARDDPYYHQVLEHADLSVPDGMPLVWLLRLKGHPIKDRVYGPDLMLMLCEEAAKRGWRCFLYGGAPGVPELLKDVLQTQFPGLNIVGTYSPPFRPLTPEEDEEICRLINATKPDILWIGLGSPKQDIWMYEHRDKLDVSVMHGVGAAFDFLTGRVKQAPRWMMQMGLEWFFRLLQEPQRLWRRYTITNLKFITYLLVDLLLGRFFRTRNRVRSSLR